MTIADTTLVPRATDDEQVVQLWLHGRSRHTQRAYRRDYDLLRQFSGRSLAAIRLADLQAFADSLGALAPASRARMLASVKSVLAFAHRIGYLPFDVGSALRVPSVPNKLSARILPESTLVKIIESELSPRNRAMLRLLYVGGLRAQELSSLTWSDVQEREGGEAQISIFGKGGKTRVIVLTPSMWAELAPLRKEGSNGAVFVSRTGDELTTCQVYRIVRKAAKRVGANGVSPHWFRHAHASHALDHGAPIHLVQETLGHSSIATTGRYLHARPNESSGRFLMSDKEVSNA